MIKTRSSVLQNDILNMPQLNAQLGKTSGREVVARMGDKFYSQMANTISYAYSRLRERALVC